MRALRPSLDSTTQDRDRGRRWPIGAELVDGGVHFRLWAPRCRGVEVVHDGGGSTALEQQSKGYFAGLVPGMGAGDRYRFRLDGDQEVPDPTSRYQPEGPLGPSQIVDPRTFTWTDDGWRGPVPGREVIVEVHIGTFTPEGTWRAAMEKLPLLAEIGINMVEMMPVADFSGPYNWGYDGVDLFAPAHNYGEPDDLRAFVNRAHELGIAVILDVVYNHFGPVGNFVEMFSDHYFNPRYTTDWGKAINYDGEHNAPVREFFVTNASYWIEEFHFDGLRLDATQNIYDFREEAEHFLAELARKARETAGERRIFIVAENEPQISNLVRSPERGGLGLDALWNDDFHHSARVALTGRREAYYTDYLGRARELVNSAKYGYLYQGQRYHWQDQPRGTPSLDLPHDRFVSFLDNHDQIANSGRGLRVQRMTSAGRMRAMTALLLLMPALPMLFQGQEFASSKPFYYFAGFEGELAEAVYKGRLKELSQFPSLALPEMQAVMLRPDAKSTFDACVLDWSERDKHREWLDLHRDLLALRRDDPTLSLRPAEIDGASLEEHALVLRFFGPDGDDRLLLVNLGTDLEMEVIPDPLLAPPLSRDWRLLWSSEHPAYGGYGAAPPNPDAPWIVPGESAMVLQPGQASPKRRTELDKALTAAAGRQGKEP